MFGNLFKKKKIIKEQQKAINDFVNQKIEFVDFLSAYNGDKTGMFAGFGLTRDVRFVDLQKLQVRSLQLARENGFSAGILNRITNKTINSGLKLRSTPESSILQKFISEDELKKWGDNTEILFNIWGKDKRLVTIRRNYTLHNLERIAFYTALLSGDCLVIVSLNSLGLPVIELVDGINIKNPVILESNKDVQHGVELDKKGVEVAYYVSTIDNLGIEKMKRISAFDKNGNRRAWLVRATEKRIDERRGLPLLSVVMQNINELGKYMDSEQRAALVNSYIAVVHNRSSKAPNKLSPFERASMLKQTATNNENEDINFRKMQPGFFATNLAEGETVTSFDTKRPNIDSVKFIDFNIRAISYAVGLPPEVLFLEYGSNYSASRQAKLDLEDFVKEKLSIFTEYFNTPIFYIWLDGMILNGKIQAKGYIKALKNINDFDILGAWRKCNWRGVAKTNIDGLKQARELEIAVNNGWLQNEYVADEYYDSDYNANMRNRKVEAEKQKEVNDILGGTDEAVSSN